VEARRAGTYLSDLLCSGNNRLLSAGGEIYRNKEFLRVQVILSRLVLDSQLAQTLRISVRDDFVELPALKRSGIFLIVDTDHKVLIHFSFPKSA